MKRPWQYLTSVDWLILVALVAFGLLGLGWTFSSEPGRRLVVTDGEQVLYVAPLDQFAVVDLEGPLGTTHLQIDSAGARITKAPCPLKICMQMGPARHAGDLLACVPNRILVQVDGEPPRDASYDLLSR